MPAVNPETYHLSASSIASIKACPQRFRLAYREGLRRAVDTDNQRRGTGWHGMHEEYAKIDSANSDAIPEERQHLATEAAIKYLYARYEKVPAYLTASDWEIEREILLQSFIAYQWYWSEDPITFLASEVPFELPMTEPRTGLPIPARSVVRVGKIDHIVRWHGLVGALERKSTTRAIDGNSDYWDRSRKDTQVSMYALAMRDIPQQEGADWFRMTANDADADNRSFGNTLYDVWRVPSIRPAPLTQKETAEFIETGKYCDQNFEVEKRIIAMGDPAHLMEITVNGDKAEVEQGKKGFAIRETIPMYGARLLQTLCAEPARYFARREIVRTDADLRLFRRSLFAVYQAMKEFSRSGLWYENESQCRGNGAPCDFIPICYGPGADAVCDGRTTPDNFKRIFVDLTVNGQEVEE